MSTRFAEVEPEPSELEAGPTFFPFTKKGESHEKDGDNCWPFGDGLPGDDVCRRGSGTEGRAAPGSRVCDRDGEPRLQPDRWESKPTVRNQYAKSANAATNYFAIGHPSSTNYLEIVGASNFGGRADNSPDFHNGTCTPNLGPTPTTNFDNPNSGNVCPIAGTGTDAETPAVDDVNECPSTSPCPPGQISIDGTSIPAASNIVGKTIGDQLTEHGGSWKSYQESLPASGADLIGYSDGYFTDVTGPGLNGPPPAAIGGLLKLYAAKHNPFVYFKSVQDGTDPNNSLANVVGFEGKSGLYEDLASGHVPNLAFIAPNQCNDQHGRGNGGSQCAFDPVTDGSQAGLNPALIYVGDLTLRTL